MPANLENSAVAAGLEKVSFIPIPKKGNAKECSNYNIFVLISHTSKLMFKILQARLQQYTNYELPDVQAGFRKGRGTRDQIANIHWITEKSRRVPENIYFSFIDYTKALTRQTFIGKVMSLLFNMLSRLLKLPHNCTDFTC